MDGLITKDENVARIQNIFNCDNIIDDIKSQHKFIRNQFIKLAELCEEFDIPQPEISQRNVSLDGAYEGIASWKFDWYISICLGEETGIYFTAENDEGEFIQCDFASINGAFALVKLFILKVVYD